MKNFLIWATVIAAPLAIGVLVFRMVSAEERRPLDVGAVLAAVESSAGNVVFREAPAGAEPGSLHGFWADPARDLVTQREPLEGSEVRLVSGTPQGTFSYFSDYNSISEGPPRPAEEFAPEDYDRQLKKVLKDGAPPRSTGGSKQVRGKRVREYEDTLPAEKDSPEAEVTLYVDPQTDLVVREEYEYAGGPMGAGGEELVRERVPRGKVPEEALLTPEQLRGIARREREERLAAIARLPHETPWLGEAFGNAKLTQVQNDKYGVSLDYASVNDPQGTAEILSIIVQDVNSKSPDQTSPGSGSIPKTTPEGKEVRYQAGLHYPDGTETGHVYFEEGGARVKIQDSAKVRGKDGELLSALEIVDELKPIK